VGVVTTLTGLCRVRQAFVTDADVANPAMRDAKRRGGTCLLP
jgi:hypothetical protein